MKKMIGKRLCAIVCAVAVITSSVLILDHNFGDMKKQDAAQAATNQDSIIPKGEMRAVWLSFLEFKTKAYTKEKYTAYIEKIMTNIKAAKMNTVIMHVRPFSDALYDSKYYPRSKFFSGKIGTDPGYDPLKIAVQIAHEKGLSIQAWINPYRVTKQSTKLSKLDPNSIIYKWATSEDPVKKRNVLKWCGQLYLNPATKDVQNLVLNGVKEIVKNYKVDGIHFDDYFYPNLGGKYKTGFDATEYKAYVAQCKAAGKKAMNIIKWRRSNVSNLIKRIHSAVKSTRKSCVFGISPAGNLNNLYARNSYYCDVKTWMKKSGYIDYICPQIYWSFTQKICPFKRTVTRWAKLPRNKKVKMYIGIAGYRAGITAKEARSLGDSEWGTSSTNLKRQVKYLRTKKKKIKGFMFFSYLDLIRTRSAVEMKNLKTIL